jgi:DNA-3-methyladenine glycosylase
MHWLLNFVTGPEGYPAGILIRGVVSNDSGESINGPARITKKLGLDGSLHGKPASKSSGLWIERGAKVDSKQIMSLPRVGVDYAGPIWSKKKWRFVLYASH